jgi:carboxyl-terminal processing protease
MTFPRFRHAAIVALASVLPVTTTQAAQADFNEVGKYVAIMLQNAHFARLPYGAETSQRFLGDYLKSLDPGKVYFTKSDVEGFQAKYGANLFSLLIQSKGIDAAQDIHATFRERVAARGEMAKKFLKEAPLDFKSDTSITRDRKDAPWPKDALEADTLLRQQLEEAVLSETVLRELQVKMAEEQGKPDPTRSELPAREKIALRYERFLRTVRDAKIDDIAAGLLGAVAASYDPHTDYMIDREATRFNDAMRNELVGIGAELKPEDDGTTRVMGIMIGGPADREGSIQLRDSILAVDSNSTGEFVDVRFMDQSRVVDLIRGKAGTTVSLKIQPASAPLGETRVVSVPRGKVEIKGTQASAGIIDTKLADGTPQRIGWITLPSFYADFTGGPARCSIDVEQFLHRLIQEKIDGLIFDVRSNGGGSLEEVRRMTGFFIGSGPVVQEKNTLGQVKSTNSDERKSIYEGPMVVLINKASASASEILAGALQDYNRAVIVGDSSTFGKGTVQEPMDVSKMLPFFSAREGAGMLKLTIRKFYRPSGSSTQLDGVKSDIVLPGPADAMEIGEAFLDRAFPHDSIRPADGLKPFPKESLFLPRLQELSAKRIAEDKDLGYFAEDAKRSSDLRLKNSVSLNIEERRKEILELHARQSARNAERRERFKAIEAADAENLKLTKLTLEDLLKGAAFHPYDPTKETEEYLRRAKDPITELNDAPTWPTGLDPIKREAMRILQDLIDSTERARVAGILPSKGANDIR